MKKILSLIFLIVFVLSAMGLVPMTTSTSPLTFARLTSNAPFFREQNNNSKMTTLPETYFVVLLGNAQENGFIRISYLDITGYVLIDDIEVVDFEPRPRHHSATFTTTQFYDNYVNLREAPNQSSSSVAQIAIGEELFFYGTIEGSSIVGNSQWFFVRYENASGDIFHGYLHYHHGNASEILPNDYEIVPPNTNQNPPIFPGNEYPSNVFIAIAVIMLSIPAVIVMFLLFKKRKPVSRETRSF
ncbi:MAG: hypothetical protein FWC11_00320 [Firmicutes bacterium]|nr:hypothetical protein [Bacillota bacterium]